MECSSQVEPLYLKNEYISRTQWVTVEGLLGTYDDLSGRPDWTILISLKVVGLKRGVLRKK